MGFFRKIFGIDKGIHTFTKILLSEISILQKSLKDRQELLSILRKESIPISTSDINNDTIMWRTNMSPEILRFFVDKDNKTLSLNFEYEFEPIKLMAFKDGDIIYSIKPNRNELSESCKTFKEALEANGIKRL